MENPELIHAPTADFGRLAIISTRPIGFGHLLVNLNNYADRTSSSRRHILQVSALSTVDGSLLDYHGCNG